VRGFSFCKITILSLIFTCIEGFNLSNFAALINNSKFKKK